MGYNSISLSGRPLTQVGLSVRDLDRARDFYRDVLGLQLLFETNGMLFFQLAGLRLMVGLPLLIPPFYAVVLIIESVARAAFVALRLG